MFIGTTNPGKVAEMASLLAPLGIALHPVALDVAETQDTFEGNAIEKAMAYANHTGGITVSEDSGLVIPVLEGLPGPWSARFADLDLESKQVTALGGTGELAGRPGGHRRRRRSHRRHGGDLHRPHLPHRLAHLHVP